MPTLLFSDDFTAGQHALGPGNENLRIPNGAYSLEWKDEPDTSDVFPQGDKEREKAWLKPESTMRSGNTALYPFTERLPDAELGLYLAPDAPIVQHFFKRYGKQWWTLWHSLSNVPAGNYTVHIDSFADIYFADHQWAGDPLSGEWRWRISGQPDVPFANGGSDTPTQKNINEGRALWGRWREVTRTFDHPGGNLTYGFEFRARYGVTTVGNFLRRPSVWQNSLVQQPPVVVTPGTTQQGTLDAANGLVAYLDDRRITMTKLFKDLDDYILAERADLANAIAKAKAQMGQ